METETPPWASPAVSGEKVGTAASREQRGPPCAGQGEAERVKRSHCEPASEPVAAPHLPTWATVTGTAHAGSQGPEEAACGWGHTGPHRTPRQGHGFQRDYSPGHSHSRGEESGTACYCSNY